MTAIAFALVDYFTGVPAAYITVLYAALITWALLAAHHPKGNPQ